MLSEQFIWHINIACITFMAIVMLILVAATRLKNGAGYMALVVVSTTIPVYLSNLLRTMDSEWFLFSLYITITTNVICFPSMWLYICSRIESSFRFTPLRLLHFMPSIISLAVTLWFYTSMTSEQIAAERAYLEAGNENLPAIINDTLLFGQFFIYFPLMFRIVYKKRRYILENLSGSNYILMLWLPRFLWLFFLLFFAVFVMYIINPRTDVWLIPILNTIGMAYLTYSTIIHSQHYPDRFTESPQNTDLTTALHLPDTDPTDATSLPSAASAATIQPLTDEQMQQICSRATEYLATSKAYLNPEISLALLAKDTGIPARNLSRAINSHLNCNFFEFINRMRVEEAKRKLLELETLGYNIDSIFEECGFRSRSTFFMVFKKIERATPAAWLKGQHSR